MNLKEKMKDKISERWEGVKKFFGKEVCAPIPKMETFFLAGKQFERIPCKERDLSPLERKRKHHAKSRRKMAAMSRKINWGLA